MSAPIPPFVRSDHGDVYVYDDLHGMYGEIEAYDAPTMDLFDATGRPLRVVVDGYTWTVDQDSIDSPEAERVASILRTYFERLPEQFTSYRVLAADTQSLSDLLTLRQGLAREPAPGIWAKLFRRSWG
jgi:hypothetical protein